MRRKSRRDRRPGMQIENALTFYPGNALHTIVIHAARRLWRLFWIAQRIKRDPNARNYTDLALTPQGDGDVANLELFQLSELAPAGRRQGDPCRREAREDVRGAKSAKHAGQPITTKSNCRKSLSAWRARARACKQVQIGAKQIQTGTKQIQTRAKQIQSNPNSIMPVRLFSRSCERFSRFSSFSAIAAFLFAYVECDILTVGSFLSK